MPDTTRRVLDRCEVQISDPDLLARALTHRSAGGAHNERLEFLGDAVLELVVTDWLFGRFPDASEGELTRLRARLVRKETLAGLARVIELGPAIALGGGELKSGGRHRDSILADAFEAFVGALYLDGGLALCETLLRRLLGPRLDDAAEDGGSKDPKTRLQEWLQSRSLELPQYEVIETLGADHAQEFIVECRVAQIALTAAGRGSSRRRAEQQAAACVLEQIASGDGSR